MTLPTIESSKLLELYVINRGYDYVWIPDIFDKLTYAEIMECRKIIKKVTGISVKIDIDNLLELVRTVQRLEQRVKDLELHNELEGI